MHIVEKYSHLKVRANVDHPREADIARRFGAKGIGLCRTEHMFFGEERMITVWKMILAIKDQERKQALKELLPMQRGDFSFFVCSYERSAGDYSSVRPSFA